MQLCPRSVLGQTRKWRRLPVRSVLPPTTDIRRSSEHVRLVPEAVVATCSDISALQLSLRWSFLIISLRSAAYSSMIRHASSNRDNLGASLSRSGHGASGGFTCRHSKRKSKEGIELDQ